MGISWWRKKERPRRSGCDGGRNMGRVTVEARNMCTTMDGKEVVDGGNGYDGRELGVAEQKIVIKVSMKDDKTRSKAMKIIVGVSGVEAASIQGKDRDQIEVTGEGVDSVKLTHLLRKKFCHANLVSIGPVEKKEEKKEETTIKPVQWAYVPSAPHHYPMPMYEIRNEDPSCTIM